MSDSKDRFGAWSPRETGNSFRVFDHENNCVAIVHGLGGPGSTVDARPRTDLIAAAPDLFAELERVAGYLNQWNALHGSRGFLQADIERRLQSVRAVLAQGRGES